MVDFGKLLVSPDRNARDLAHVRLLAEVAAQITAFDCALPDPQALADRAVIHAPAWHGGTLKYLRARRDSLHFRRSAYPVVCGQSRDADGD